MRPGLLRMFVEIRQALRLADQGLQFLGRRTAGFPPLPVQKRRRPWATARAPKGDIIPHKNAPSTKTDTN